MTAAAYQIPTAGDFIGRRAAVVRARWPVARNGVSARVETEGRRDEDAETIVEKGH